MGSKPFSFDVDDLKSLGWTLLDVSTAATLTWLAALNPTDTGTVALIGVLTVLVKAGRKWISDNTKRWQKVGP